MLKTILAITGFVFGALAAPLFAADINNLGQALNEAQRLLVAEGGINCIRVKVVTARNPMVGPIEMYGGVKVVHVAGERWRVSCSATAPPTEPVVCPPVEVCPPTQVCPPVQVCPPAPPVPPLVLPGDAQLTWNRPTTRADNSALAQSEISVYQVFAITGSGDTEKETFLGNTAALMYQVTTLIPGTYRFALRTVDTKGLVSSRSAVVSVTIK